MSDRDQSPPGNVGNQEEQPKAEHLNIKVTDNNNEVFFKIKRTTALSKLMNAFCDRQGKQLATVRFLFDGARVNPTDTPDLVSHNFAPARRWSCFYIGWLFPVEASRLYFESLLRL